MFLVKWLLFFLLFSSPSFAQSPGGFVQGQVLTAAELNSAFQFKVDSPSSINTTTVTARPASTPVWPNNAFTGTNTGINFGSNYTISGTATLGQPSSGYLITPELSPFSSVTTVASGWNQSNSSNDGRTLATFMQNYLVHNGQGDASTLLCDHQLNNHKVGATNFLANPAISCIVGQYAASAGGAGGFINPLNSIVLDNGFDIAVVMDAANGTRTNATGALGEYWFGTFYQSLGAQPWNAFFRTLGPSLYGVDLTSSTFVTAAFASTGFTVGPTGIVRSDAGFNANGNAGLSVTKTVRAAGGASDCTLIFTQGLLTGGSC